MPKNILALERCFAPLSCRAPFATLKLIINTLRFLRNLNILPLSYLGGFFIRYRSQLRKIT